MQIKFKLIMLGFCAAGLASCVEDSTPSYDNYAYTSYSNYGYSSQTMQSSYIGNDLSYESGAKAEIAVPDSYYVGSTHSPVSFKDRDKQWVSSQNPQGYTVEIADEEKASSVAGKLYQLPKNDRMAQVKYQRDGKGYYKGIYGSYESQEAAKKALDALPAELRVGASVKEWKSVQKNLD